VHGRYYHQGRAVDLPAGVLPPDDAHRLIGLLLAGTDDMSQMLVYDALIDEQRTAATALELVLPASRSFDAGVAGRVRLDRVFVPLSGPHAAEGDAVTVFIGEGGYRRGPFHNPHGRAILAPVRSRAEALVGG
jgi:NCAIR mutase (PurE)-related protein